MSILFRWCVVVMVYFDGDIALLTLFVILLRLYFFFVFRAQKYFQRGAEAVVVQTLRDLPN